MLSTNATGILPPEFGELVRSSVAAEAVAMSVTKVINTNAHAYHVPRVVTGTAANWVAEGAEIPASDLATDEIIVLPAKVVGVAPVSNEVVMSSDPSALEVVGDDLTRRIAAQIDAAFFGALPAPAPSGLESLTGVTEVDGGAAWNSPDPFIEAVTDVAAAGGMVDSWVCNAATAKAIHTIKTDSTDSNVPLVSTVVAETPVTTLLGRPLHVSDAVAPNTVWGVSSRDAYTIVRGGAELAISTDAQFTKDMSLVRAKMFVGFAFPREGSLAKITVTAA